jgi:hypothetical protein
MDEINLVPTYAAKVAALGGFLEGISYLNQDHRSYFAEAFVVDAVDDSQFPKYIETHFPQLSGLTVRRDENFQASTGQLEKDIVSLLLIDPHAGDERLAQEMRSYLSFKVMDRLDDIINDWERMNDDSVQLRYDAPKRFIGTHDNTRGQMVFYLLSRDPISFVLYFHIAIERF